MKKLRILIWGTGDWCERLLNVLPENCYIEAFVETTPNKDSFCGKRVISKDDFIKFYESTDFTIVAVLKSDPVIKEILRSTGSDKNIYVCKDTFGTLHVENLYDRRRISINQLFDNDSQYIRQNIYYTKYVVRDCREVSFIVSTQYGLMIDGLSYNKNHQEDDINLFFSLAKEYYGVEMDSSGYFFDIGANIGTTSLWVKKKINPNLNIVAFEPSEENCKQYKCNCILNDINEEEVTLVKAAISNIEQEMNLMLCDEGNLGDHRICINGNKEKQRKIEKVKTFRLDNWIKSNSIESNQIKYIWMDTQAHEAFCIDGASGFLQENLVPLYIEFWPAEIMKNKSMQLLVDSINKFYKKFICIAWYKEGDRRLFEIEEMWDMYYKYNQDPEWAVDLFFLS